MDKDARRIAGQIHEMLGGAQRELIATSEIFQRGRSMIDKLWSVVFVVDGLSFREHALVQNPANQDAAGFLPVKHCMLG